MCQAAHLKFHIHTLMNIKTQLKAFQVRIWTTAVTSSGHCQALLCAGTKALLRWQCQCVNKASGTQRWGSPHCLYSSCRGDSSQIVSVQLHFTVCSLGQQEREITVVSDSMNRSWFWCSLNLVPTMLIVTSLPSQCSLPQWDRIYTKKKSPSF